MKLQNLFLQSPDFSFENNIFYQKDLRRTSAFEKIYLSLREKEQRVYADDIVKSLPDVPANHTLQKEWRMRKSTLRRLMRYLRKAGLGKQVTILELGCGNGWLCHQLSALTNSEVLGVDINEQELLQGARLFKQINNLCFLHADIITTSLPYSQFDSIILSASLHYFRDLDLLFAKLYSLLAKNGEIHVLDSPIYHQDQIHSAQSRTRKYFEQKGFPMMGQYHYHHSWKTLNHFEPTVLYNPYIFLNKIRIRFFASSPFPWIKIKPHQ